jgi:hypothetical protein
VRSFFHTLNQLPHAWITETTINRPSSSPQRRIHNSDEMAKRSLAWPDMEKTSFPKDDLIRTSQDGLAPCIIISRQCQSTISEPPPAMRLLISRCGTASRDDPSFVFMMRELVPARSGMQAGLFFFASIPVLAKRVRCC